MDLVMQRAVGLFVWVVRFVTRMVATVLACTLLVFVGLEISIPQGFRAVVFPAGLPEDSPAGRALIDRFHLDSNVFVRWGHWVWDCLNGDFGVAGTGFRGGEPVADVITHRLPISAELMLVGLALMVLVGIPLGVLAASRSNKGKGAIINTFLGLSQSIPVFITATFLIWLFALKLEWLPAAGWTRISKSLLGNLETLLLPAIALAFAEIGIVARVIRSDVLRELKSDYVAAAIGKGLSERYVLFRHVLRPASLGLLNVIGVNAGALLSGALVVEIVFGIGGLGRQVLEATLNRDLYLLLALTAYTVIVYVIINGVVDALMQMVDPRLRRSRH